MCQSLIVSITNYIIFWEQISNSAIESMKLLQYLELLNEQVGLIANHNFADT